MPRFDKTQLKVRGNKTTYNKTWHDALEVAFDIVIETILTISNLREMKNESSQSKTWNNAWRKAFDICYQQ